MPRLTQPTSQTSRTLRSRPLPKLSLLALCCLSLVACGDATTTLNELPPQLIEKPQQPKPNTEKGRLLVTDKNSGTVAVFDLNKAELINELQLTSTAEYAYSSPSQRYAVLVQRAQDRVQFIDGGVWEEDHGDHMHPYAEAPQLMKFSLTGIRPTHVQTNQRQIAVFNDGLASAGAPASVDVISETVIATDSKTYPRLSYSTHQHGAAQPRGEFLVSTIRDATSSSTLPDTVGFYQQNGDGYRLQQTLTTRCPSLHGSAQNSSYVVFGCTDGVLWLEQQAANVREGKIANTAAFTGTARIGTLEGHPNANHFIGMAGTSLYSIDVKQQKMLPIEWQPSAGSALAGYGFSADGKRFAVLDNKGVLSVLNYQATNDAAPFTLQGKLTVVSDISTMPTGSGLQLSLSGSDDRAYVLNPITRQVLVVDLVSLKINRALQTQFVPHRLVWTGIAKS